MTHAEKVEQLQIAESYNKKNRDRVTAIIELLKGLSYNRAVGTLSAVRNEIEDTITIQ